jgi:hypothetical protein
MTRPTIQISLFGLFPEDPKAHHITSRAGTERDIAEAFSRAIPSMIEDGVVPAFGDPEETLRHPRLTAYLDNLYVEECILRDVGWLFADTPGDLRRKQEV